MEPMKMIQDQPVLSLEYQINIHSYQVSQHFLLLMCWYISLKLCSTAVKMIGSPIKQAAGTQWCTDFFLFDCLHLCSTVLILPWNLSKSNIPLTCNCYNLFVLPLVEIFNWIGVWCCVDVVPTPTEDDPFPCHDWHMFLVQNILINEYFPKEYYIFPKTW